MIEKDDEREGGGYQASLRADQSDWGDGKGGRKGMFESEHEERTGQMMMTSNGVTNQVSLRTRRNDFPASPNSCKSALDLD